MMAVVVLQISQVSYQKIPIVDIFSCIVSVMFMQIILKSIAFVRSHYGQTRRFYPLQRSSMPALENRIKCRKKPALSDERNRGA